DATVAFLSSHIRVAPSARALSVAQDRLSEKTFISGLGIPVAPFHGVGSKDEAFLAFRSLGGPGVLKTRRLGYDGKAQTKVVRADETGNGFAKMAAPSILEKFLDFSFEASVIGARGHDGSFTAYDPPENIHEHHILRRSVVPGRMTTGQSEEAKKIARTIA